jgi:hypothetical protein
MLLKTCKICGEPLLGTELELGYCLKCVTVAGKKKNKKKDKKKNKRKLETLQCQCGRSFDPGVETGKCKDCDSYICDQCSRIYSRCAGCALDEAAKNLENSLKILARTIMIREELEKVGLCENCLNKLNAFVDSHKK